MKKLLLLVVMCFVGMMVPQVVLADEIYSSSTLTITTSDGPTVTIHSEQAGALWALLENGKPHEKNAVINALTNASGVGSKIVFDGFFCGDDLQKLQKKDGPQGGQYDCCVQETVDMEKAEFKKRVDLTEAMDAYKISVDAKPNDTEAQINTALNGPSKVGTCTVSPRAAWTKLIGTSTMTSEP